LQWLPNQLQAVLTQMVEAGRHCVGEKGVGDVLGVVEMQRRTLAKDVDKYCKEQGV
jgi:indoleamine 2,3-dioxygenase